MFSLNLLIIDIFYLQINPLSINTKLCYLIRSEAGFIIKIPAYVEIYKIW